MNLSTETRELFLAYDLLKKLRPHFPSGSEQPAFEGWFEKILNSSGEISYCRGIDTPIAWREKAQEATDEAQ